MGDRPKQTPNQQVRIGKGEVAPLVQPPSNSMQGAVHVGICACLLHACSLIVRIEEMTQSERSICGHSTGAAFAY